jgi:hypothetical protein
MFILTYIEINYLLELWYKRLIARFRKNLFITYAEADYILY